MKRLEKGMEKWGHYLLAMLCAGVMRLSAAWTRDQKAQEKADQLALSDQSQRLDRAQEQSDGETLALPVNGFVIRDFSMTPVLDAETGLWQTHPYLDFAVDPGDQVKAAASGDVIACDKEILIRQEDGRLWRYQGLDNAEITKGTKVKAGETLGRVQNDSPGFLRVSVQQNGEYIDFGKELAAIEECCEQTE